MTSVKWIKITTDMFDDEKIKIIQVMPEGDALLVIWIKLIILAGKTNEGGYIYISDNIPYTEEMLSVIMNKPLNIIQLAINTFIKLGMLERDEKGIYLINFEKHQSLDKLERLKEQNRLRVAKFRNKQKQNLLKNDSNDDVTLQVMQSNAIDIDKEEDIDSSSIEQTDVFDYYQNNLGHLTSYQFNILCDFRNKLSDEIIKVAIDKTCNGSAKNFNYLKAILQSWVNKNYKTLGDIELETKESEDYWKDE